jgi:hypothetical protein
MEHVVWRGFQDYAAGPSRKMLSIPSVSAAEMPVEIMNFLANAPMDFRMLAEVRKQGGGPPFHRPGDDYVRESPGRSDSVAGKIPEMASQSVQRNSSDSVLRVHW